MRRPEADPYLPGHGDPSYDVLHYDLDLDYALENNHLTGRATLTLRARTETDELTLDLHHLKVVKVTGVRLARHTHRGGRLRLVLQRPLAAGAEATVVITYRGTPKVVRDKVGEAGWEELEDGVIVASQPGGAPSWFPCNDRPDDKATYRITVTAASSHLVVANGVRTAVRRRASRTTWTYEMTDPMATYLATVQIGRYAEHEIRAAVPLTAAVPPARRAAFDAAFADQPRMIEAFVRLFGPYPFNGYRVVVTDDELEIPLEAQGLSIFGSNLLSRDWDAQRLIAHELAHQWFGNAVTVRSLCDIWLHEGFACYSEWLWSQESGGPSADARAREHWARLDRLDQDLVLYDPGPKNVFDDRVYKRGALTLHSLRLAGGDEAFFDLLRTWVARHRGGSVGTEDFVTLATERLGSAVRPMLDAWVYAAPLPELPMAATPR
ncbi:M1 family metallopeptidase [Luteipulveratus flavus]|uniref:Aminopeptidase N n=1 Tax=Luteipulveratus flavus TaxID=3031728 RepID=A0ABT6C5J9_9MICO|nr:M1 family metallopeptidase [Luteipulveratus sp. YIM 133296]MDF8264214.1 M1 family metallopeptidase [Luteipulveratus sp. YIM 133296]